MAFPKAVLKSKPLKLLLFPAFIFIFAAGWILFWFGQRRSGTQGQSKGNFLFATKFLETSKR